MTNWMLALMSRRGDYSPAAWCRYVQKYLILLQKLPERCQLQQPKLGLMLQNHRSVDLGLNPLATLLVFCLYSYTPSPA